MPMLEEGEIQQSEPRARVAEEIIKEKHESDPMVTDNSSVQKEMLHGIPSRALLEKDAKKEAEIKAQAKAKSEAQVPDKNEEEKEKALVCQTKQNQEKAEVPHQEKAKEPLKENSKINVDGFQVVLFPKKMQISLSKSKTPLNHRRKSLIRMPVHHLLRQYR